MEVTHKHERDKQDVQKTLDVEHGLSSWEVEFLDSLWQWLKSAPLTPKQRAKLDQIMEDNGL